MAYFKEDPDKILVHGRDNHKYDGLANAAVSPGQILTVAGVNGEYPQLAPGQATVFRVAKEYSHTGMTINDDYASGDHMEYYHAIPGEVYFMPLAAGESVTVDDDLVADTSGNLRLYDSAGGDTADMKLAKANEAVDNSGGAEPVFVLVTAR